MFPILLVLLTWFLKKRFIFLFRGLFIIDDKGVLRQITMNDLPVSHRYCSRRLYVEKIRKNKIYRKDIDRKDA